MTRQEEEDITFVLQVLQEFFPGGVRAETWEEETGNTVAELDEAMKRLGGRVGIDAGLL